MKAVVYSFTRRGAMLSINIGEALQKFDFEVRCLTMPKFAEVERCGLPGEKVYRDLNEIDPNSSYFSVILVKEKEFDK